MKLYRLKKRLELLDTPGIGQVLSDYLDIATEGENTWTPKGKQWVLDELRREYNKRIAELTPKESKQQKLFE